MQLPQEVIDEAVRQWKAQQGTKFMVRRETANNLLVKFINEYNAILILDENLQNFDLNRSYDDPIRFAYPAIDLDETGRPKWANQANGFTWDGQGYHGPILKWHTWEGSRCIEVRIYAADPHHFPG